MRIPASVFRLQLTPQFTLEHAARVAPHLRELGIGDLYLSPIMAAVPGSLHGYDVTDPARVNPELGGDRALCDLAAVARELGMGLLVDTVPNHMAASHHNRLWWDVLAHGRESQYAEVFDIDWEAPGLEGKVLLPVLGAPLADVVAAGELVEEDGELRYYDRRFPLSGDGSLEHQHYELAHWRDAATRGNYRRFFDIADLVALRAEREQTFELTHRHLLDLVGAGVIQGVRIDHIDGLADPLAYLTRLRSELGDAYLVVEKIVARDERLPADWPVAGTTGYEWIAASGGLIVDPEGAERITAEYVRRVGGDEMFPAVGLAQKRRALETLFATDLDRVMRRAPAGVSRAEVAERTVALPVYRTYETGDPFVTAWQQLSGPVAAKGVEDTGLYRDVRLVARNEPGLEPEWLSTSADDFHGRMQEQLAWHSLNPSSTHDTKRGEDVRARIAVLSELAGEWIAAVDRWRDLNGRLNERDEWLVYQTLVGAWPIDADRLSAYMLKAAREAKLRTSWTDPDERYERDLDEFVRRILDPANTAFLSELQAFADRVAERGWRRAIGLLVLKLAAPGVPDIYWANELWDLSLVDPDNRRPVDFDLRARMLAELAGRSPEDLAESWRDGGVKLHVTRAGLRLRRAEPELFRDGGYRPIAVEGPAIAFARTLGERWVICVARTGEGPLGALQLPPDAPSSWRDVLTGEPARSPLDAEALTARLGAALLTPEYTVPGT